MDIRPSAEEPDLEHSMADDEVRHWSQVGPVEHGIELKIPVEVLEMGGGDCDGNEEMGGSEDDGADSVGGVAACLEGEGVVRW